MRVILAGPSEPGRQVSRPRKTVFAVVTLVAGLVVSSACEKVPLLAPSQTTITLSAASTIVQANGSTEIRATLLEQSGTPVQNGTTVTFSTTLGRIEPREARTLNGTATVLFVATGQSGEAEIRAASGGAKPADTANPSIKIKVGAAAAARIQVNATRDGPRSRSWTIGATVSDASGNPLAGIPVTFSADAGTLSSSVATTSSTGEARVTLSTNRDATVTATTGAASGTTAVTGTVKVTVTSLPTLSFGTITPSNPVEDQTIVFPINVTSSATSEPFESVVVSFGDGTSRNLGAISGNTTVSHAYSSDGIYTVTVTGTGFGGDITSATTVVSVGPRPPIAVTIASSPAGPSVGTPVVFMVTVTAPTTGAVISNVSLNYGDGTPTVSLGTGGGSTSHAYCCTGSYTVTATVRDNFGATSTASTQVSVGGMSVSITFTPTTSITTNTTITFTAFIGTAQAVSYQWNFNNEASQTTTGNTASYRFTTTGTKVVTVTVTGAGGSTGTGQTTVVVQ